MDRIWTDYGRIRADMDGHEQRKPLRNLSNMNNSDPKRSELAIFHWRRCKKQVTIKRDGVGETIFATPQAIYCLLSLKVCKIDRRFFVLAETCAKSRREQGCPKTIDVHCKYVTTLTKGRQHGSKKTTPHTRVRCFAKRRRFPLDVC